MRLRIIVVILITLGAAAYLSTGRLSSITNYEVNGRAYPMWTTHGISDQEISSFRAQLPSGNETAISCVEYFHNPYDNPPITDVFYDPDHHLCLGFMINGILNKIGDVSQMKIIELPRTTPIFAECDTRVLDRQGSASGATLAEDVVCSYNGHTWELTRGDPTPPIWPLGPGDGGSPGLSFWEKLKASERE